MCPLTNGVTNLPLLAMESFGRLGEEGSKFIDYNSWQLVSWGGGMWWVDGKERSGEGTPTSNGLADCTSRHFISRRESRFKLRRLRDRQESRRSRGGGGGCQTHPDGVGMWSLDAA